jgi:hypothetical protein
MSNRLKVAMIDVIVSLHRKVSARDSQGTARREPGLGRAIAVDQSDRLEGGVASVVAL